jgi:hypothetical protein
LVRTAFKDNYISENQFKELDKICTGLRAMLVASINTAKGNSNEFLQNCKKDKEFIKQTFSIT